MNNKNLHEKNIYRYICLVEKSQATTSECLAPRQYFCRASPHIYCSFSTKKAKSACFVLCVYVRECVCICMCVYAGIFVFACVASSIKAIFACKTCDNIDVNVFVVAEHT